MDWNLTGTKVFFTNWHINLAAKSRVKHVIIIHDISPIRKRLGRFAIHGIHPVRNTKMTSRRRNPTPTGTTAHNVNTTRHHF
jgi:hypothetical protein